MSSPSKRSSQPIDDSLPPPNCIAGCGFYGNPAWDGYCSMCYEKLKLGRAPLDELLQENAASKFVRHRSSIGGAMDDEGAQYESDNRSDNVSTSGSNSLRASVKRIFNRTTPLVSRKGGPSGAGAGDTPPNAPGNTNSMTENDYFDLVIPYKEQVDALKEKLRLTDLQLRIHEVCLKNVMDRYGHDEVINYLKTSNTTPDVQIDQIIGHRRMPSNSSQPERNEEDNQEAEIYLALLTTEKTSLELQLRETKEELGKLKQQVNASSLTGSGDQSQSPKPPNLLSASPKFLDPKICVSQNNSTANQSTFAGSSSSLASSPSASMAVAPPRFRRSLSLNSLCNLELLHNQILNPENSSALKQLTNEVRKAKETTRSKPCEMCRNYELQLQSIQNREADTRRKLEATQDQLAKFKEDLKREKDLKVELDEQFKTEVQQYEEENKALWTRLDETNKEVAKIRQRFDKLQKFTSETLNTLTNQKEELAKEVARLTRENETLLGRYVARSQDVESQPIDLPQDLNEVQFHCLKLREDLITTLVAKERIEETLKAEILFLKDEVRGEQMSKERIEDTLSQENCALKSELEALKIHLSDLEGKNQEQEDLLTKLQEKLAQVTQSSQAQIDTLQWQVNDLSNLKVANEEELNKLRNKVQSLQMELENSEAVQQDFVRLSQSLQVQLENIRQGDNSLRWQHEDDATECSSCKKSFHSKKEKNRCHHCCKIFCADCNSKQIGGGPKSRMFKVCNVCHTLLDPETAPYFSNEPPPNPS